MRWLLFILVALAAGCSKSDTDARPSRVGNLVHGTPIESTAPEKNP
jgi:hypothetical protein